MSSSTARRQHRLALVATAVVVVTGVAGCGQSSAPDTTAAADARTAATGAQPAVATQDPGTGTTPATGAAPSGDPEQDFLTPTAASVEVQGGEVGVVRSRALEVDTRALPAASVRAPQQVSLPLFDDTTVDVHLAAPTVSPAGYRTWNGLIDGDEGSSVVLVARDGVLSGLVTSAGATYRLQPQADGTTRVEQVDQAQFPSGDLHVELPADGGFAAVPEAEDEHGTEHEHGTDHEHGTGDGHGTTGDEPIAQADTDAGSSADTGTSTGSTGTAPATAADGSPVVDVLVGYTAAALTRAGGQAAMDADIALVMEQTNTAFATSGINAQVNLVHSTQVATNGPVDGTTLGRVANPGDGVYDELNVQRDAYGADLVALIVDSPTGPACGIAYLMNPVDTSFSPYAVSVTDLGCATGNMSFTHELGHNFGAAHDRGSWSGTPALPYGYDWVNQAAGWRTVMAYTNACQYCGRLLRFSNPDQTYNGAPLGAPVGAANAADNRSMINTSVSTVASMRGAPVPSSFSVTGPSAGQPVTASGKLVTTWSATGNVGTTVKVELLRGGTAVGTLTATAPLGAGRYEATLPLGTARGDDYTVKATPVLAPQYAAQSDAFSVVDPVLTPAHTLANAAEGTAGRVTWTYTGAPGGSVKVELLKDGRAVAVLAPAAPLGTGGAGGVAVTLPTALNNGSGYQFRTTLSAVPVSALTAGFPVTSARQLAVTAPTGGGTVTAGTPLRVTWTASGTLGASVRADLVKGGVVVGSSATAAATAGTLTFTPPAKLPTGTDYRVQLVSVAYPTVVATNGGGAFALDGSSVTVTSQDVAGAVTAGRPLTITFGKTGAPGSAVLLEAVSTGRAPVAIATSVPLTAGSFTWNVPVNLPRADWRVRATVVGNALVTDTSTAAVSVSWPTLSVTNATAAVAGAELQVGWAFSEGAVAPVRVRLLNGTTAVATASAGAATAAGGSGSLTYRLPANLPRGTYRVEVAAAANTAITATSSTPVTVTWPTVAVTNTAAAVAGTNVTVSWTLSDGAVAPVRIRLLNGTAVTTVSGSAPTAADGTGSVTYRLPLTLARAGYQVEVALAGNTAIVTTSATQLAVSWPTVSVAGPAAGVAGADVAVSWTLSDGVVSPVRVRLVQGTTAVATVSGGAPTAANGSGSLTYRLPVNLAAGSYQFEVAVAGNVAIVRTGTAVPVTLPSLTVSGATSVVRGQAATLSWAFGGGAVAPVRIDLVQGGTVVAVTTSGTTGTAGTGSFVWRAPTTLAPGAYTLRVRPTALATSSAIEGTRAFTVS